MVQKSKELKVVDSYFEFMWNANLEYEFGKIFGSVSEAYSHGQYLFEKYLEICDNKGMLAAPSVFWSELCSKDKEKLIEASLKRANIS